MEIALERCIREKPDMILLPLVDNKILKSKKEVYQKLKNIFNA